MQFAVPIICITQYWSSHRRATCLSWWIPVSCVCNRTLRPSVARDYLICPLHEQHACTNQDSSWSHYNAPAILYIIVKLCLCVSRQPPCPHRIIQGYQIWHSIPVFMKFRRNSKIFTGEVEPEAVSFPLRWTTWHHKVVSYFWLQNSFQSFPRWRHESPAKTKLPGKCFMFHRGSGCVWFVTCVNVIFVVVSGKSVRKGENYDVLTFFNVLSCTKRSHYTTVRSKIKRGTVWYCLHFFLNSKVRNPLGELVGTNWKPGLPTRVGNYSFQLVRLLGCGLKSVHHYA